MQEYKKILKNEVTHFKKMGYDFLEGKITRAEFKGLSGGMGCYAQRDGKKFMIRLRTPSGIISKEHLDLILNYTKQYKLDKIHLTTRQAVQLHDLSLDNVCDIMVDAIDHDLFTRGGGGNYPRNVSLSPLSGVEKGEAFDVTPYALQVGHYFLRNSTTYKLPRKLKVAFSSSELDRACATINDLGFIAVIENGKPYFKMWLTGGMGNGAAIGIPFDELIEPEEVLYYVEAMIQLFIEEGDYTNKAKARTRFIPKRMGVENFLKCYHQHLEHVKQTEQFDGITPIIYEEKLWKSDINDNFLIIPQKQENLYSVILHPACGQIKVETLEKLANFLENLEGAEIRSSMEEDIYVRNLSAQNAQKLLDVVETGIMHTKIQNSVSCIGTPTCQMGILQSQNLYYSIIEAVNKANLSNAVQNQLPSVHISGCPNSCTRHQVVPMGFTGKKKQINGTLTDVFELYIDGNVSKNNTHMGKILGCIKVNEIPNFIVELGKLLEQFSIDYTRLLNEKQEDFNSLVDKYLVD